MKPLARHWQFHLAVLITLMGLLTLAFIKADTVSPETHYRYLENLRNLQQADVETTASVLATHAELMQNYDALVSQIQRARKALLGAAEAPDFLSTTSRQAVLEKTSALSAVFEKKVDLIERYKRGNSIFRNSADYFPRAANDFLQGLKGQQQEKYATFIREILIFSRNPTSERIGNLNQQIQHFRSQKVPASELAALDHLLPHAQTIINRHPEVDGLVRAILDTPTTSQLNELMLLYTHGHEESLRQAGRYHLLLYAVAVLLLVYVVYAYTRIERSQSELRQANEELNERVDALRRAEQQTRLYSTVFTNAAEGMMITDADSHIVAVNPTFCAITGYSLKEVIGKKPSILHSGRHDAAYYEAMWQALGTSGKWSGEIWNRRHNGEIYPEWLSITTVRDEAGKLAYFIGIFSDITERKQSEERIRHLAHHDPLTNLPNRLLLTDRLEQGILKSRRSHRSTAVLFLDLDRFKNINDTLGHEIGDLLLIEAAERGKAVLRETDTISRLGGDEFVIILPEMDTPQDAGQVARKLLQGLSQPFHLAGHDLRITGSIGVALCPEDGKSVSELLRNADTAMYRAKEEGRNLFRFYSVDMNITALGELLLESHLRAALEHGELFLHYQPKYDAESGALLGSEALMRWEHPEHGLIPPARFIPLAEECGLISALGEWALNTVCSQQRQWLDAGLTALPVAVNVSAQQFSHQNIPALVACALEENNLPPELLELELTESLLMRNPELIAATIRRLRDMRINMAIDDFGTGYSSLSYLKQFPVQTLKIDRAFVQDIDEQDEQIKLAPAIIALAHSMQMKVIAEGVETEGQRDYLIRHDCDQFQGYLFARPMSADAFAGQLRQQIN